MITYTMQEREIITGRLFVAAFFALVFLYFTKYVSISDLWWHLSNGRWIIENMALPSTDPFSHVQKIGEGVRANLLLKGFWLSQVLYYTIYSVVGIAGLILINAVLLAATPYLLWSFLRARGISLYTACLLVIPSLIFMGSYSVRPKNFSYLAVIGLFIIIETGLTYKEKTVGEKRPFYLASSCFTPFALMPLVMLLWPNLHRGYFLGYVIIGTYLVSGLLTMRRAKSQAERTVYTSFFKWAALAIAASFINPNPLAPFIVNFQEFGQEGVNTVLEFYSLSKYAISMGVGHYVYAYYLLAILLAGSMALSFKKVRLEHFIFALGFFVMGLKHVRFSVYFALIAPAMISIYMPLRFRQKRPFRNILAGGLCAVLMFFIVPDKARYSILSGDPAVRELPKDAIGYMAAHELPGELFNPYEWGGYISWRLHPRYKVFIDARMLDFGLYEEYKAASNGFYREIFHKYGINTVMVDPFDVITGYVSGLCLQLLKSTQWDLVHYDSLSAIFVRRGVAPGVAVMEKHKLREALVAWAKYDIARAPLDPKGYMSLSGIYYSMGLWEQAAEAEKKGQGLKGR